MWRKIAGGILCFGFGGLLTALVQLIPQKRWKKITVIIVGAILSTSAAILYSFGENLFVNQFFNTPKDSELPSVSELSGDNSDNPSPPPTWNELQIINSSPPVESLDPEPVITPSTTTPSSQPTPIGCMFPSPPPIKEPVYRPLVTPEATPDYQPEPTPTIPVIDISSIPPSPAKTDNSPPPEMDPSEPILPPYELEVPNIQEPEAPEPESVSGIIVSINYAPVGVTLTVQAEDGTTVSVTVDNDITIYRRNTMKYIGTDSLRTGWECIIYFSEDGEVQEVEVSTECHVLEGVIEEVHFQEDSSEVLLRVKTTDGASEIRTAYSNIADFYNGNIMGRKCEFLYWDNNIIFAIDFLD